MKRSRAQVGRLLRTDVASCREQRRRLRANVSLPRRYEIRRNCVATPGCVISRCVTEREKSEKFSLVFRGLTRSLRVSTAFHLIAVSLSAIRLSKRRERTRRTRVRCQRARKLPVSLVSGNEVARLIHLIRARPKRKQMRYPADFSVQRQGTSNKRGNFPAASGGRRSVVTRSLILPLRAR